MSASSPVPCDINSLECIFQPLLYTHIPIVAIVQGLPIIGEHVYCMYVYTNQLLTLTFQGRLTSPCNLRLTMLCIHVQVLPSEVGDVLIVC
jgi:hypothetical protein